MRSTIDWQNPFVDVFRKFNVFDSSQESKKGNISDTQDKFIGRRVLKLDGKISAANYINIPDPQLGIKSLQLTGRYIYIEFLPSTLKRVFNMYLDFVISDREQVIRFSISNLYEFYHLKGLNSLNIPFP